MMSVLAGIRQQGTVLITVMLMVAVAALIATDMAYRQQMDVLRTGAFLARDAGGQYLLAAEELGMYTLEEDRKEDDRLLRTGTEVKDDKAEIWNREKVMPLPDGIGIIEGKLYDLNARFNINSLADPDAQRQSVFANAFMSMMSDLLSSNPEAFPEGTTASMLKERVIDWLDIDDNVTGFDGKEDNDYFRKERPYRTANHFISDISELLLIDGFTPQALELLEDKISFLPLSAKVNLYTADENLLNRLGFSVAEVTDFTKNQRANAVGAKHIVEYQDLNQLYTYLLGAPGAGTGGLGGGTPGAGLIPGAPTGPTTQLNVDWFDIKSEYFLLKGKAVVNGKPVLIESVLWKPPLNNTGGGGGATQQPIPVKTILRKFVDPLKQTN